MTEPADLEKPQERVKIFFALTSSSVNQLLIQFASVPLFLRYFSHREYAIWLIASSIAQFSSLLDLGTVTSSQNTFQMLSYQTQSKVIHSRILQLNFILAITFVCYGFASIVYSSKKDLKTSIVLIAILLMSNYLQAIVGIYEGLTRAQRKFSKGILSANGLKLFDFLGLSLGILLFSPNLIGAALTSLGVKFSFFFFLILRSSSTQQFFTFGRIKFFDLRNLLAEGFPFLLSKLADWLFVSGAVIVLSTHFKPSMIVFFVLLRTFFRQNLQISILIGSSFAYSSADAWARKDLNRMKTIVQNLFKIQVAIILVFILLNVLGSSHIFLKWTHNEFALNSRFLLIGIIYSSIVVINQSIRNFFNSINLNRVVSRIYFIFSILQLIALRTNSIVSGPESAFIALAITEILILGVTSFLISGTIKKQFAI